MLDLRTLTSKEIKLVTELIALLRREQASLQTGNAPALPALVTEKGKLVEALNALARQRNELLASHGLGKDKVGMTAWLESNPGDRVLKGSWQKLLELAEEARQIHLQNGQLVTLHLQETSGALAALNQEMQKSLLYGADGLSSAPAANQLIDSA